MGQHGEERVHIDVVLSGFIRLTIAKKYPPGGTLVLSRVVVSINVAARRAPLRYFLSLVRA